MFKRAVSLLFVFTLIINVFAACTKKDGSNANLTFPITTEPRSLDPQVSDTAADIVTANCFEGLVRTGENGEILPGVALSWDVSGDGLVYTFHLRNNAKWHLMDGFEAILGNNFKTTFNTAVTAQDFVYGFRRAVDPQTASALASSLFMIKNAQAVNTGTAPAEQLGVAAADNRTLKITLTAGSADFLNLLASPVCMPCSEEFFEAAKGKYGLGDDYLLCNGPFYLSVWNQGSSLLLRKNSDYAGNSAVSPNSVTLKLMPDNTQFALKLTQGGLSAAPVPAQAAASFTPSNDIMLREYHNIVQAICMNCADPSLMNPAVRLALCKAIDKSALGTSLNGDTKTGSLIPPCCTVGQTRFEELSTAANPPVFNPVEAKNLWDTALKELGTKQIVLSILCPPEYEVELRGLLQIWQKTLGISLSVSIEVLELTQLQSRVSDGNYQIALAPVQTNKSSAAGFLQNFDSSSPGNILNYSSDTYDGILRQIHTAGSQSETVRLCELAQNHLLQSGAVYPFLSQSSYFAMAKGVAGIYTSPAGERVFFIDGSAVD